MWWIRSDPCGIFSASFTVFLVLYALYNTLRTLVLPWYGMSWHVPIYSLISILSIVSHSRAQFSDPGTIPKRKEERGPCLKHEILPEGPPYCKKCRDVRTDWAHHCSSCAQCVIRMDHHCPWVNNCVAMLNQKYFMLFLFYTCSLCVYSACLLIARLVSCTQNPIACSLTTGQTIMCVLHFIEALIFGLFTAVMMYDQFQAIITNTPGIDAMQGMFRKPKPLYESLKDTFGEPFSIRWFLPVNHPPAMMARYRRMIDEMEDQFSKHSEAIEAIKKARPARDEVLEAVPNAEGGAAGKPAGGTGGNVAIHRSRSGKPASAADMETFFHSNEKESANKSGQEKPAAASTAEKKSGSKVKVEPVKGS